MKLHETDSLIRLEPLAPANAAVIWLHGLGADGHDFVPIVPELGLAADHAIRFLFPHAPVRTVTINNGMPMRAWYDIRSLTRADQQDSAGIRDAEERVAALIAEQQAQGIAAQRIVIAGFSQGGAIALHAGIRHPERLAGVVALSTYLPVHQTVSSEAHPANRELPIFMAHGRLDQVVPYAIGETSARGLRAFGYPVEWHEYPMQHQVCEEELEHIGKWLQARLPPST
jgi:phospholipase/carboxylesterase